jgi:hypothetical protein
VDLIRCDEPDMFDTHLAFLSYGDVGNILGRVAALSGLKYGHQVTADIPGWTRRYVSLFCFYVSVRTTRINSIFCQREFIIYRVAADYALLRWCLGV